MTHVSWFIRYKIDAVYYTVVGKKMILASLDRPIAHFSFLLGISLFLSHQTGLEASSPHISAGAGCGAFSLFFPFCIFLLHIFFIGSFSFYVSFFILMSFSSFFLLVSVCCMFFTIFFFTWTDSDRSRRTDQPWTDTDGPGQMADPRWIRADPGRPR